MFFRRRVESPATPQSAALADPAAARLPAGAELRGRLQAATHLAISGRMIGDLVAQGEVYVAPGGFVEGSVRARAVVVAGRVVGPVRGAERIELVAGASVEGDVASAQVIVADGADLRGTVDVLR